MIRNSRVLFETNWSILYLKHTPKSTRAYGNKLDQSMSKRNYTNDQQFITLQKEEHLMNETPKSLLIFLKVYKEAALLQAQ